MRTKLLCCAAFLLTVAFAGSAFGDVATELWQVSNTFNTPGPGQGQLVINVWSYAYSTPSPHEISYWAGGFDLDATFRARVTDVSDVSFTHGYFAGWGYTTGDNYDPTTGRVTYSYSWGGPSYVELSSTWQLIVVVTITYDMASVYGSVGWAGLFSAKDEVPNSITATEGTIDPLLTHISLPVELSSFTAFYAPEEGVNVAWRTESETNCEGFHVWRGDAEDAEYARVTSSAIPGHGDSPSANDYSFIDRNVVVGSSYWYKLEQIDYDGAREFFGPILTQLRQEVQSALSGEYALLQNYPNPFNPATQITYDLPEESSVILRIYNLLGEDVRTLVNEAQPAGSHTVTWDGRTDEGTLLGSGVYFYKLAAGNYVKIRKMVKVE